MTLEERFDEFLREDLPYGVESASLSVLKTAFMKGVAIALYEVIDRNPLTVQNILFGVTELGLEIEQMIKSQKKP